MEHFISVIIVSYNTERLLDGCLSSLYDQSGLNFDLDVQVIDNNSSDNSVANTSANFPQVRLFPNPENVGFARAVNECLPRTIGKYILLLNSDADLRPGCLGILVNHLESNDRVAAACPAVVRSGTRLRVLSAGRLPALWPMLCHYSGLSRLSRRRPYLEGTNLLVGVHDDRVRSVEWVSGACVMLRRAALESVGSLSERWFMYGEDMELCGRMRASGWSIHHVPEAVVEHEIGASSPVQSATSTAWVRNLYDYYLLSNHPGPLRRILWRWVLLGGLTTRLLWLVVRGALRGQLRKKQSRVEITKFLSYARAALALRDAHGS